MVALFVTVSIECGFNFSVHRRVTRKSGMPRVARVDAVKQKIVPLERILMRTLADAKRYTDIQHKKNVLNYILSAVLVILVQYLTFRSIFWISKSTITNIFYVKLM